MWHLSGLHPSSHHNGRSKFFSIWHLFLHHIVHYQLSSSMFTCWLIVFVWEQHIFSSLMIDYLPEIPLALADCDNDTHSLKLCQKPHWVDPHYVALAYTHSAMVWRTFWHLVAPTASSTQGNSWMKWCCIFHQIYMKVLNIWRWKCILCQLWCLELP